MKNKKGQIGILITLISTLILVGVVLTTGWLLDDQLQEQIGKTAYSTINETDGYINSTGYTLDSASLVGSSDFSITEIYNGTLGSGTINSANYTVSVDGVIRNATTVNYNNVSISYTFNAGEEGYKGIEDHADSMTTVVDFLPLIILVLVIGIVLLILFAVIPNSRSAMTGA